MVTPAATRAAAPGPPGAAAPTPVIASPAALGRRLRRLPVTPTSVAALLGGHDDYTEFRRVVREVFPEAEAEIRAAGNGTARERQYERVAAFLNKVQSELFPTYELEVRSVLSKLSLN